MKNPFEVEAFTSDVTSGIGVAGLHNHDFYEIYVFLGDEMDYFLDSIPLTLHKNDIVLVDKYLYHKTLYVKSRSRYRINIRFGDSFLNSKLGEPFADRVRALMSCPILKEVEASLSKRLNELAVRLCECFEKNDAVSLEIGYHILSEMLLIFVENKGNFTAAQIDDSLSSIQKRISKIAGYINQSYAESLTLQSIADRFFLSKYYLCRSFKEVTGIGITEYINKKRASEAAFLLRNSSENITKIGELAGFNTQAYFIGVFKKYYGKPPSAYREAARLKVENRP